jgi:hypothetical protein
MQCGTKTDTGGITANMAVRARTTSKLVVVVVVEERVARRSRLS